MLRRGIRRPSIASGEALSPVLERAQEEARSFHHNYVGTEHLLLSLLREKTVQEFLGTLDVAALDLRRRVESQMSRGTSAYHDPPFPFTNRLKAVLEHAEAETERSGNGVPRLVDLLSSLILERDSIAGRALSDMGLSAAIQGAVARTPETATGGAPFRIDETSDLTIYEQLSGQIAEAIAVRDLVPGDRLPSVRQLADQLDVAPGTVARVYSDLERRGVLVTEGPKGTRIAQPQAVSGFQGLETLVGLLRPVAVAAFHLGAEPKDLRSALENAMQGIFHDPGSAG